MPIETAGFIADLTPANPLGSDPAGQGDDHLRLIKSVLLATLPNMGGVLGKVRKLDTAQTISAIWNTSFIVSSNSATATVVLTLPAVASITGGWYVQLSTQVNYCVLTPQAGASINTLATFTLPPNTNGILVYDGGPTTFRAWKWPVSVASTQAIFEGGIQVGGPVSASTVFTAGGIQIGGQAAFLAGVTISAGLQCRDLTLVNGQITFPATQVPSAGANTLDDYEEGTFTPTFSFATPGNLSVSYSYRVGEYTKVGRDVHIYVGIVAVPTHTTAAGNSTITGLPFTAAATGGGPLAVNINSVQTGGVDAAPLGLVNSGFATISPGRYLGSTGLGGSSGTGSFPTGVNFQLEYAGHYRV